MDQETINWLVAALLVLLFILGACIVDSLCCVQDRVEDLEGHYDP